MAIVVELPRLSDTMEEGVIAKWHIGEGDKVKRGQVIAEIETDKATMEFESFDAGTVLRLVAPEGETLPLGAPIAVLGKPNEDVEAALSGHGSSSVGSGSAAKSDDRTGPAGAGASGPETEPELEQAKRTNGQSAPAVQVAPRSDDRIAASPLARRLARENGIDLANVRGSGPHGRIVKTDVEQAASGQTAQAPGMQAPASTPVAPAAGDQPIKLSQMRKTIAKRMSQANAEIPHFYLTVDVDMSKAVEMRAQLKEALPDTKISFNDLVLYAATRALVRHPEVNSYWNGETIVRRGAVNIGMAVAVDEGLIVPAIRNAHHKTLGEIATEARDLGLRGRDKKLSPEEMTGSTFTVSNLGMFGIEEFSAVVNPGEGAILAVGVIRDVPDVRDGELVVGKRMKATLACDHRVMDGAIGAMFLATFRSLLEQPLSMMA
jgi:pyruvate dehydrogenase E2 component (dihydrolipoamide acetyltransferase)